MDDIDAARILDGLADAVVVIGPDAVIRWGNPAAERIFGMTLDQARGLPAFELIHPDDLHYAALSMQSVTRKAHGGSLIELRLKTPTGYRLVEVRGAATGDDGPIVLAIRDITERRRYEVAHDNAAALQSLLHNARTVTILLDADARITSVSGALSRISEFDTELVTGQSVSALTASPEDTRIVQDAVATVTPGQPVTVLTYMRGPDGAPVPVELTVVDLRDDPVVAGYVVSAHEVTERVETERQLRSALSLLEATLDSTADGILVVDGENNITSFNRRFVELWRIPDDVLESRDDSRALAFVLDQLADPAAFIAKIEELYASPASESYDTLDFKDGRVFERVSRPQRVDGRIVGRVWCFRDLTEHKRLEDELVYRAFHDQLTGLANKARFCDRLHLAAHRAQRTGKEFAVLFLDLDNFKTVNDSLGHHAGDQLLVSAAHILGGCLRSVDVPARLGGDEFAILVEDLQDREDAVALARRIRDSFRQSFRVARHDVSATVSIGIAFGADDSTSEEILRDADLAMYMAKSRGKDRFELFHAEQHDAAVARVEVEAELRQAIGRDELMLFYQPMVELATDRIAAVEALVRWDHPERGLLLPGAFVPLAEETGLMQQLGHRILMRACNETRELQRTLELPLKVSVNVSAVQLVHEGFAAEVAQVLTLTGFDPALLVIEITETAMLHDAIAAKEALTELRAMGISMALDDFGTGYSSLTFLQHFPIDIVKIDKSFVSTLDDPFAPSLAPAVLELAQNLGLTTVAEGVETARQLERLRELGCDLVQGFFLHRPYAVDALYRCLAADEMAAPV